MYKVDISDGFYHVLLSTTDIPKLSVHIPKLLSFEEDIVAFPLDLPMGWAKSLPFFCLLTACNLVNKDLCTNIRAPA